MGNGTWARRTQAVEFAVLAARVDASGKFLAEARGRTPARRSAGSSCLESTQVSRARSPASIMSRASSAVGMSHKRKEGRQAGAGKLALAVVADIAQEQVAENDRIEPFFHRAAAGLGHPRFVVAVGAGPGQRDLPERDVRAIRPALRAESRRTPCMATRSAASLRVVRSASTRTPCRRSTCSAQALSFPELQASRVFGKLALQRA